MELNLRGCTSLFKMLNYWRKPSNRSPSYVTTVAIVSHPVLVVHRHFPDSSKWRPPGSEKKNPRESWSNSQSCVNTWHWRLGKLRALRRWFAPNRFTYVSLKTRKKRTICTRAMTPHGTDGEKIMTIFSHYLNCTLRNISMQNKHVERHLTFFMLVLKIIWKIISILRLRIIDWWQIQMDVD